MAARDDRNTGGPSLAELWLKERPGRRAGAGQVREGRRVQEEPRSAEGVLGAVDWGTNATGPQLGLLFSAPVPRAPEPSPRRIFSVAELVSTIRGRLEHEHPDVLVEGEISNCRAAASGHLYLTLKDGEAQLSAVMYRNRAQLLRFRPQDGVAVLARGRISVYEQRGQLQLIAESLEPLGAGALQLAFEQLKARLLGEGLFDAARKRALPAFPHCVGVITSTAGAVLHDIIRVTRRRHARLDLLVYPAAVQGAGCAASVMAGIAWFNANADKVDLVLIARGGGSIEDLAGFNDEGLARAIAASALPVVSAVGHETDFTIADFVADLRAPTPSAAAEMITAAQHGIEERVAALDARVARGARYHLALARQRLVSVSVPAMRARMEALLGRRGQRLDDLNHRLEGAASRILRARATRMSSLSAQLAQRNPAAQLALARRRLERANEGLRRLAQVRLAMRASRVDRATARLHALSPIAVLDRGYALVYLVAGDGSAGGKLLRESSDAKPGDAIRARLARGSIAATVRESSE